MSTFELKIIASDREFYNGYAESLVIPVEDGEKAILAHHENMVIATVIGELRFTRDDGAKEEAVVGYGFTRIMNNRVLVLVDSAEHPDEIDVRRAQEAEERAKEKLRQKQSIREYYHSQASLARAMSRLKVTGKYNR
ncbi:MAG: ATP synthase F1 subunit epsilon [Lachnospiraceae bacterium]